MSRLIRLNGAGAVGATGSSGRGGGTPAGDVTLGTPSDVVYLAPDNQGIVNVKITVPFTPPGPLGTWDHVTAYLVAPDDTVTTSKAVVQNPGSGNIGFFVGPAGTGANIVPNFTPIVFGPFHASENMLVIVYSAPQQTQTWRIYAVSGSTSMENTLVPFGAIGASPSVTVSVAPSAPPVIGAEFAPCVAIDSFSGDILYAPSQGGQWTWGLLNFAWAIPSDDPRFPLLGGYNLYMTDGNGNRALVTSFPATQNQYSSPAPTWPVPENPSIFVFTLLSFDLNGNENSVVYGVTPQLQFVIEIQPGRAGEEYTSLVAGQTASVSYQVSKDGVQQWKLSCSWVNPNDVTFGGVLIKWNDGSTTTTLGLVAANNQSGQSGWFNIGPSDLTLTVEFISVDVNFRQNSFQGGVTPVATVNVVHQHAGLQAGNIDPGTLATSLAINSGILGVAPAGITNSLIAAAAISQTNIQNNAVGTPQLIAGSVTTVILTTSEITIGSAGANMPIRFRIYDHSGNPIGWIGDDTANSGFVGAWFKQLYVGGSGPAAAPFEVNSSGQLSINMTSTTAGSVPFQLVLNSVTTEISNPSGAYGAAGLQVFWTANSAASAQIFANSVEGSVYLTSSFGAALYALLQPGALSLNALTGASLQWAAIASVSSASSGSASALPSTPAGYLPASVNGSTVHFPFYN